MGALASGTKRRRAGGPRVIKWRGIEHRLPAWHICDALVPVGAVQPAAIRCIPVHALAMRWACPLLSLLEVHGFPVAATVPSSYIGPSAGMHACLRSGSLLPNCYHFAKSHGQGF